MINPDTLRQALLSLGFDAVRFARIEGETPGASALDAWLGAGHQADMAWIARNADKRRDPQLILSGARTMILLGVNYSRSTDADVDAPRPDAGSVPIWARYALYEDYHDTLKPALERAGRVLEETLGLGADDYRYYVDTGPVLERSWAERSGLGFVGKNAMLISREFGNWLFLAAILVRAELVPDPAMKNYCGRCTRCIEACPTHAIVAPGVVDARRCISYLTIENKGHIPEAYRKAIGSRIYGCDICAEQCPWNRFAQASRSILLSAKPEIAALGLRDILCLSQERFSVLFRGSPIKRIKLAGLLRNACVVAGNSGDRSLLPELEDLTRHESPLVREHAEWAIAHLENS